jgi:hypothetical protein
MKRVDLSEHEGDDNIIKFPGRQEPSKPSDGEKFSATWAGIDLESSEGKQSFKDGDPEFFTGSGKRP